MAGVAYLHNFDISHGDLKGVGVTSLTDTFLTINEWTQANILIDNAGIARVADFGLMSMVDLSVVLLSITAVPTAGTFCWMSPELLDPLRFGSSGRSTRESDRYALGMVIYEVSSTPSSQ